MKIYYLLILDKSGSMGSVTELTKNAMRAYLDEIKKSTEANDVEGYASILAFDSSSENPFEYYYKAIPCKEVDYSLVEKYRPSGGTQILDAIARGVIDLQTVLGDELGNEDVRVLVSIYSDGGENSSKLFTRHQIKKMIELLSEDKWTFTFQCAGAEEGIREFSRSISIADGNVQVYKADKEGYTNSYASLTSSLHIYTSGIRCQEKIENLFAK